MHEHVACLSSDLSNAFPGEWLDKRELCELATDALAAAKERFGLGIFVDGTPCDLGRDAELLRQVSIKSGVHIVASSGLYYFPSMISVERSADDLYALLKREIDGGLDGTDVKPGILKCAIDAGGMTVDTQKRIAAIVRIQAETGLPLYAHCAHTDNTAFELIDLIKECGGNPAKIVIGHASRRLDIDYIESLLDKGVYICIDQSYAGSEQQVAQVVRKLCQDGYERKLLFSHDKSVRNEFMPNFRSEGEMSVESTLKRLSYFYDRLIPELKRLGFTDDQCNLFLHQNALDVLDV